MYIYLDPDWMRKLGGSVMLQPSKQYVRDHMAKLARVLGETRTILCFTEYSTPEFLRFYENPRNFYEN